MLETIPYRLDWYVDILASFKAIDISLELPDDQVLDLLVNLIFFASDLLHPLVEVTHRVVLISLALLIVAGIVGTSFKDHLPVYLAPAACQTKQFGLLLVD